MQTFGSRLTKLKMYSCFVFHLKSEITSIISIDFILITLAVETEIILFHLSIGIINTYKLKVIKLMGQQMPWGLPFSRYFQNTDARAPPK